MLTKLRVLYLQARNHGLRYAASKLVPVPMATTYGVLDEPIEDSTIIEPAHAATFEPDVLGPVAWVHDRWWQWRDRVYRLRSTPVGV